MSLDHDYGFAPNSSKNQAMTNRVQDDRLQHITTTSHPNNVQERRIINPGQVQTIQYIHQEPGIRSVHPVQRIVQRPIQPIQRTVIGRGIQQGGAPGHQNTVTYVQVAPQNQQPVKQVYYRSNQVGGTAPIQRFPNSSVVQTRAPIPVNRGPQQIYQVHTQNQQQPMIVRPVVNQYNVANTSQQPKTMNLTVPLREPSPVKPPTPPPAPPSSVQQAESTSNAEPIPDEDIDIQIRNVVCNYTLPLHIDLRKVAMCTNNVTYEREKGVMMKQKRNPNCYIKLYSSGKVYIVGCRSEDDCRKASRSIARHVQKVMGKKNERIAIRNYRINNVLATCRMPFGIKIEEVAAKYPSETQYEPELSVGLIWKSVTPKATLRIHTTGSITVTGATSEGNVLDVIAKIYDIVVQFRCQERSKSAIALKRKRKAPQHGRPPVKRSRPMEENYGSSGVVNNAVYFSDEDADLYDELDLDD